jgi:hypothetical protein
MHSWADKEKLILASIKAFPIHCFYSVTLMTQNRATCKALLERMSQNQGVHPGQMRKTAVPNSANTVS